MISLDETLLLQMVNFLILLWILNRFLYRPILEMIDRRRNRIRESEDKVRELEDRASRRWEEYERQLQEAKIDANLEKERIKGEGLETQRKVLEEVRAEASGVIEDARKSMDEEIKRARALLKDQAEGIAREMSERILGRRLQ